MDTNERNRQVEIDVGVIKSQLSDIKASLTTVEAKIDNNSYVHTQDYKKDQDDIKKTYATKDEIKPLKNMFYAIITTVILGLISAFMTFVIRGGIK